MGHHIGNMHVFVMADSSNNRHRASGYGYGKVEVVKAEEVRFRAAAAEDEDGVIILLLSLQKGICYGRRGLLPLHCGLIEVQGEGIAIRIVQQVIAEILVTCSGFGGDDGKPLRDIRDGKFLLHIHIAVLCETLNGALSFKSLLSKGEGGVNVFNV